MASRALAILFTRGTYYELKECWLTLGLRTLVDLTGIEKRYLAENYKLESFEGNEFIYIYLVK